VGFLPVILMIETQAWLDLKTFGFDVSTDEKTNKVD
jgi:hypothetical protein